MWNEMNRKQRREMMRKVQSEDLSLQVVHPHAAGIDIGNESHYVAVPPSRDPQPVRCFGCTTAELKTMAQWLTQCGIRTVAMQSTGVYWIAVYDILEEAGMEVYLVNARETKNLPGRKTDVQESQWLMKLHTYGLLRNSFRPSQEIRILRTYWRQRQDLVRSTGRHIQRMQKALTQMNIQLGNAITGNWRRIGIAGWRPASKRSRRLWRATGKRISCLSCGRNRRDTSFAKNKSRNAISSWHTTSRDYRIGPRGPLCRKKRERDGARRRKAIHSLTCGKSCFA